MYLRKNFLDTKSYVIVKSSFIRRQVLVAIMDQCPTSKAYQNKVVKSKSGVLIFSSMWWLKPSPHMAIIYFNCFIREGWLLCPLCKVNCIQPAHLKWHLCWWKAKPPLGWHQYSVAVIVRIESIKLTRIQLLPQQKIIFKGNF